MPVPGADLAIRAGFFEVFRCGCLLGVCNGLGWTRTWVWLCAVLCVGLPVGFCWTLTRVWLRAVLCVRPPGRGALSGR